MIKYLQLPTCKLAEFASNVQTTFTVSGFLLNDKVTPVAPADIGDICYATLEPKTVREELISFTITSVTAAGVATIVATRGLSQKSPYGAGGASFDHQNGSAFVISNNPGLFNQLTAKDNAEVITAQWSFPAPTLINSPVTKAYADALVINGGADATNLTRGVSLLSASPAIAIGTATITIATPAVISFVGHGLIAGDTVKFTTTIALPTGLVAGTSYYVIAAGLTANTFQVAATIGGAAINTSGTQSGVHTLTKWTPIAVGMNDTTKLPTLSEKAAMAGGGAFGVPSGSNKFVTQTGLSDSATAPVVQILTVSGTWTKPVGLKYIIVELVAGGGGGGGSASGTGAGGGAGGSASVKKLILAAALAATEAYVVGAGGIGGAAATTGGIGGNSTFSTLTATGGPGGGGGTGGTGNGGGAGGATATSGDYNYNGTAGAPGTANSGGAGGTSSAGIGRNTNGNGGSGGNGSSSVGNAGSAGVVIITQYYL